MVLRAAEGLSALPQLRAALIDVVRYRGGAHEAQRLDVRMLEQGIDRHLVALYHVEDAGGEARLLEKPCHEQRRRRVALAWFQHESVAAGDGERGHPARHHAGEVERRDTGDYAERLAQRPNVETRRHLGGEIALQPVRKPARKFDDLDAPRDFALRVREHLAVLAGDACGELIAMLI